MNIDYWGNLVFHLLNMSNVDSFLMRGGRSYIIPDHSAWTPNNFGLYRPCACVILGSTSYMHKFYNAVGSMVALLLFLPGPLALVMFYVVFYKILLSLKEQS